MKGGAKDSLLLRTAALARTTRQLIAVVQDERLAMAMLTTAVVATETRDERLNSVVEELIEFAASARERSPKAATHDCRPG